MKKIIVAEEFKDFLSQPHSILSRSNVKVFLSNSAENFLKTHRQERANLIIMDYDMQGMRGDELCATIRRDERLKKVAVVIACPKTKAALKRCGTCGANAVIEKPVRSEELLHAVSKLLSIPERGSLRAIIKLSVAARHLDDVFFCISQNISVSGMLVETNKVLGRGDTITCSFVLQHKISVTGEIVRVVKTSPDLNCYGVRFLSVDPQSETEIKEYVQGRIIS